MRFIASLAANIFLGGFVAGRMMGGPPHFGFNCPPHMAAQMMLPDLSALSPEGRDAFHQGFTAHHDKLRGRHEELEKRRMAFAAALAADPWDRAKAESALADLKASTDEQEAAFAALIIDAVEGLSPDDRKAFAEIAASGGHWRGHRRMHHRSRDVFPPPDDEAPPPSDDEPTH
ncbi:MAG TPA: periplasmic heavy metal sensor [Parvularculaceae bacterium]|nr:periplasmic heavy metal sensor [Parvularculaceae bacterium]